MPVRKKNNPVKRYEAQARCAVNGLCFGMKPGDTSGKVDCWRLSTGKITPVGPTVAKALGDCHFKFAFLLVVISKEANGKQRIVTDYNRMAASYKHSDLVHYLNAEHDAIIDKEIERGNDIISAGWLAVPVPKMDDDLLIQAMKSVLLESIT